MRKLIRMYVRTRAKDIDRTGTTARKLASRSVLERIEQIEDEREVVA